MWNLVVRHFHFLNSSKDSARDQFIFWTFNNTEIAKPEQCKKRYFENSQQMMLESAAEAAGLYSS